MKELLRKPLPLIPQEIQEALEHSSVTPTSFDDKNEILRRPELQTDAGFTELPNGDLLVSMYCPMPGITPEMIEWWFWWHPQDSLRYRVWFPGGHYAVGYAKKDGDYFGSSYLPPFQPNTQYPTEKIAGTPLPLRIDFVSPTQFGFDEKTMRENGVPLIVCGHVGAFGGIVYHTEMAHIFRQTDDGLFLFSRFWIGYHLKNPILRKIILNGKTAKGMAEHCCVEYRNLAEILPELYNRYRRQRGSANV